LRPPIIGVGAPAHLFLPAVSERLGGTFVLPEGAPVANAVGAATGAVMATISALVRPEDEGGVVCYAPERRVSCVDRASAIEEARRSLIPLVQNELREKGAITSTIDVRVEHRGVEIKDVPDPIWWESMVTVHGVGQPRSADSETSDAEPNVLGREEWVTTGLKEAEERIGV
jgi:hypothetical protein